MKDLTTIKNVYFLGIGGIGMSSLARYFHGQGKKVSGYDKTETTLTQKLVAEGIFVHYDEDLKKAPSDAELVVYTPAIPKDHRELVFYLEHNYPVMKRSEVLGKITEHSFNVCVAGTHGKTTVSTMIAHILKDSGFGCNAFLGGISVNYNSNFWSDAKNVCVVEADEYDRSFLRLSPDIAVITAMDADHLDIYGSVEELERAYLEFSRRLKPGGLLLTRFGLQKENEFRTQGHKTYSMQASAADVHAGDIRIENGGYNFDMHQGAWNLKNIRLNMGGLHNVENAVAAIGVAHGMEIADEKIILAVASFKGVKRRFEYILPEGEMGMAEKAQGIVYIDDYAHHPEELRALIGGARNLFPDKRCVLIFQPHLYSRTRDFADGFAASLDLADDVVVLPIYPAREKPIAGVDSGLIVARMKNHNARVINMQETLEWIEQSKGKWEGKTLLVTAGAGDIDRMIQPIKQILTKKN